MKLDKMAISYEHAKQLRELGVLQLHSYACYIGDDNPDPKYNMAQVLYSCNHAYSVCGSSWFESRTAAFTTYELGQMLIALTESDNRHIFSKEFDKKYPPANAHLNLYDPAFLADCIVDFIIQNSVTVTLINNTIISLQNPKQQTT